MVKGLDDGYLGIARLGREDRLHSLLDQVVQLGSKLHARRPAADDDEVKEPLALVGCLAGCRGGLEAITYCRSNALRILQLLFDMSMLRQPD